MNGKSTKADFIKGWIGRGGPAPEPPPAQEPAASIAIIGMDGRFPGCGNIEEFWQALAEDKVLYGRHSPGYLGTRTQGDGEATIVAGLIESALDFDPRFFRISGTEAELMDPQLRQLLMSVQRAIEDSGHTPAELAQRRVGVFVGAEGSEYNELHAAQAAAAGYGLNHAGCSLAHRVSYHYDFKGPSEVIDTMCSSGAYCIYRATQLLRSGEIDVAIVAAVKLQFNPRTFEVLEGLGMTSRSECRSFHRDSAGYVRSEGVVTLLLKRDDLARADRDATYARIREVAVNFSGRDGSSMFTPSKNGQKDAMKRCYRKAGVSVADVAYVEAQGMGNEIADFVEFSAINEACSELAGEAAAGAGKSLSVPVISTVKPLLGHMECVSALGALLRIIFSLRTRRLYRIPRLEGADIHPGLGADGARCRLLTADEDFDGARTMLASLNSFGASGTNVHILVEQGDPLPPAGVPDPGADRVLVVSAASHDSLQRYLHDLHRYLEAHGHDASPETLCRTFQLHREQHRQRVAIAVPASTRKVQVQELRAGLLACMAQGKGAAGMQVSLEHLQDSALARTAGAWLRGETVDWAAHHAQGEPRQRVGGLPTYPFALKPYRLTAEPAPAPALAADPGEAADDADLARITTLIVGTLSASLKIDAAEISNDAPFADFGVDSITVVNLIRALNERLQLRIEATTLFDHSTVSRLAAHLCSLLPSAGAPAAQASARGAGAVPRQDEPIAIVGMSGRFAESESLEAFWGHVRAGRSLVREVSRWPGEACIAPGKGECTQGSFIDSIDQFDPFFFNISPLEALYMDPQQRLFLEEAWKALEHAGYAGKSMEGRRCGVYAGCNFTDYTQLFDEEPPEQAFWGVAGCVIPARISYYLNLRGPAVMVDTACSSSLVAVHTACQGLWSGEIDMALAGAVFLQSTPTFFRYANRAGMLSQAGRCATFDAGADGFVPGEGVGVLVLKRLADALRDGDTVHGVIAGSGINQDGRTNGITAPSASSQEDLECSVYDRFGIRPEGIQLVEAHGTGTRLGDPIEFTALARAFARYTDKRQFCAIGSVKSNVGHTSAAAGMAGLLKILLALQHGELPPTLHFNQGNPLIDFASSPFYVNTQVQPWPAQGGDQRRAAISSFGFSGTNAHMVIEQAPAAQPSGQTAPAHLVVLSACTAEQLRQQARNLVGFTRATPAVSLNDLAYTLLVGRLHRSHRLCCLARSSEDLVERLLRWLDRGEAPGVTVTEIQEGKVAELTAVRSLGNHAIRDCRHASDAATALGNLGTVADLYGEGYELEFHALFPEGSRRIPLPTYPFARERFWVGGEPGQPSTDSRGAPADLATIDALLAQIESGALAAAPGVQKLKELA